MWTPGRLAAAFLATSLLATAPAAAQERPTLTVYTYDSFTTEWGPGPRLEAAFEERCDCDLELVGVEDGVALLSRLRLEGTRTRADIVLGLDTNLIAEARATGLLGPHGQTHDAVEVPGGWDDEIFVPYDWSYFAFVYDSETLPDPPRSMRALVEESDAEILIQDPRTSTPGLGLLLWMKKIYGDRAAEAWEELRPRIVTVSAGWSESYGLFQEGEAPMVLSYTTSPAYHIIEQDTERYKAAIFEEGHYMQIEVAAKLKGTDRPELADRFLSFLLSDTAQSIIPTTNWMYPAVPPENGLPEAFAAPLDPDKALLYPPETVAENRDAWIREWLNAMSR